MEIFDNPYFQAVWIKSSDAMAISDGDGIVLAANQAYLRLYGFSAPQVIGHSFAIIFPENERPQAIKSYKTVFAADPDTPPVSGQHVAADSTPYFESTIQRAGGEVRIVESRIEYIYENGRRAAMLSVIRDITEQRQTKTALDLSEARQRLLMEIMPAAVLVCDQEGLITYYNQRATELWGRRPKLVDPEDRFSGALRLLRADGSPLPHCESPMAAAILNSRSTRQEEVMIERPDGTRIVASVNVDPLYDQSGQRVGGIDVFEDITSYKQTERQLYELNATLEQRVRERTTELERSNRELDQFAYIASHDLKAPLRSISNLASWVSEDAAELLLPSSQEHLAKLGSRVKRMEVLLDDLLAYSRAGRKRQAPEIVDIASLIQTIAELLAPPGFVVNVPAAIPPVRTERVPLETVLRNLIGNAIKHHPYPSAGIVNVTAHLQDQWVEFSVRDNGAGIDPIYHESIFDVFRTLKARDEIEGSGMGLSVVKKLVESRGGTVRVTSSLGKGATFYFTWPATILPKTAQGPVVAPTSAGS